MKTDEDVTIHHDQIISTRLYILLWTISLIVLSVYYTLYEIKSDFEIKNILLNMAHYDEFTCTCSKIAVPFQTFISFDFNLHQVNSFPMIG